MFLVLLHVKSAETLITALNALTDTTTKTDNAFPPVVKDSIQLKLLKFVFPAQLKTVSSAIKPNVTFVKEVSSSLDPQSLET